MTTMCGIPPRSPSISPTLSPSLLIYSSPSVPPPRPVCVQRSVGPHAEAREALRARQLLAADLTGGSGIIRSPEASASTLLPYTAAAKPKYSRFGALARLRDKEARQREVRGVGCVVRGVWGVVAVCGVACVWCAVWGGCVWVGCVGW